MSQTFQSQASLTLTDPTMANIRAAAPRLLQRVQQGLSKFELVYVPHTKWPLPHPKLGEVSTSSPLRISVLDSSFNPPTLAHLSLANSLPPSSSQSDGEVDYSARLLLLSVKNVDKSLKPGDALYEQRLEMMHLLVKNMHPLRLVTDHAAPPSVTDDITVEEAANAAIAIVDEPTFVGKSHVLRTFLEQHLADIPPPTTSIDNVELTFLVGHDTLERLFAPRYYPSEEAMVTALHKFLSSDTKSGDHSRLVSAKRVMPSSGDGPPSQQEVDTLPHMKEFLDSERIAVIDMGDTLSTYSSTTVRRSVGSMGQDGGLAGSWRRLVTEDVAQYIVKEGLYKTEL